MRRKLRREIRAVQAGEDLPPPVRTGDEWLTHAQDTVLPIPPRADVDDTALLQQVTDAVMSIVFAGDELTGAARREFVVGELKKLKHDARFVTHQGDT